MTASWTCDEGCLSPSAVCILDHEQLNGHGDPAQRVMVEQFKSRARELMRHDPRVWFEALDALLDALLPGFWNTAQLFKDQERK